MSGNQNSPGRDPEAWSASDDVYSELRKIAARYLQNERREHTLQPTALVHEAFLRLGGGSESLNADRRRFVATAARVMRNVLVDHARARNAEKRGGGRGRSLDVDLAAVDEGRSADIEQLDEALTRLEALHPRQARVVELRFFGGLTVEDTAALLDSSVRTVERDWTVARAWLRRELRGETAL
ncbi:MAG: ECF-type sigma factor [Planctomycetota bacterium]